MYVLWNNQIIERSAVKIDIEDRGYQFGDGLYEAIRLYNGKLFMYNEHFDRLERCAKKIRLDLPFSRSELFQRLVKLVAIEKLSDGEVYLQVTRGISSPRNHLFPVNSQPVLTANITPFSRPVTLQRQGKTACLVKDQRWLHCDIKSLSLLGNLLSLDEAIQRGFDDALLVRDGYFTEASASNLWFVINGCLYTHQDGPLVLPGITKMQLLRIIHHEQLPVKEIAVPVSDLDQIEECFLTNSIEEIIPVISIDGKLIGNGHPGKLTKLLQQKYLEQI
ncbi:D-amino-acid transaminase [Liquorilactobacillus sicerae]|uniref:D-amino-acid transaminase n=1 Tax=Liquorilactobacillus sicerae TaxID=1416943 RepID=UPI00247FF0FF|nr:D-amino-acid transaminase [Liquorilactobacillus sicerae]